MWTTAGGRCDPRPDVNSRDPRLLYIRVIRVIRVMYVIRVPFLDLRDPRLV
jgi:hypothetical protein